MTGDARVNAIREQDESLEGLRSVRGVGTPKSDGEDRALEDEGRTPSDSDENHQKAEFSHTITVVLSPALEDSAIGEKKLSVSESSSAFTEHTADLRQV